MDYENVYEGIRVTVRPRFSLADSDPSEGRFVFEYQIRLANEGEAPAQLLYRHWDIHDSGGEDTEVDGDGVVGVQPLLAPGQVHEYRSFCVLSSPLGHMEGFYTFTRIDGSEFRVAIPRFGLEAPLPRLDEGEARAEVN